MAKGKNKKYIQVIRNSKSPVAERVYYLKMKG
jgi:hypothetical protein